MLNPGDPAPIFVARSTSSEHYHFDTVAGRYVVLCFFGSAGEEAHRELLSYYAGRGDLFDDRRATFFGVSIDPEDERRQRVKMRLPGYRFFWDFDRAVSRQYGVAQDAPEAGKDAIRYRGATLVLDPLLRVVARIPFTTVPEQVAAFERIEKTLPPLENYAGTPLHAPVLVLPRIFEPELCRKLIELYEEKGGVKSGFMREVEGKTVGMLDDKFKRRADVMVEEEALQRALFGRIRARMFPEIFKAFQFRASHLERYLVACYDGGEQGFFRAHRDNTTKGTAHRKFAVTINLNTEEYDGGDLRFPEFGPRTYRAPTGGAVVFSCSLLHEATPVTNGKRYAFLPFLYDEAGAKIREQNMGFLSGTLVDLNAPKGNA